MVMIHSNYQGDYSEEEAIRGGMSSICGCTIRRSGGDGMDPEDELPVLMWDGKSVNMWIRMGEYSVFGPCWCGRFWNSSYFNFQSSGEDCLENIACCFGFAGLV